jgi:hypothetical protein
MMQTPLKELKNKSKLRCTFITFFSLFFLLSSTALIVSSWALGFVFGALPLMGWPPPEPIQAEPHTKPLSPYFSTLHVTSSVFHRAPPESHATVPITPDAVLGSSSSSSIASDVVKNEVFSPASGSSVELVTGDGGAFLADCFFQRLESNSTTEKFGPENSLDGAGGCQLTGSTSPNPVLTRNKLHPLMGTLSRVGRRKLARYNQQQQRSKEETSNISKSNDSRSMSLAYSRRTPSTFRRLRNRKLVLDVPGYNDEPSKMTDEFLLHHDGTSFDKEEGEHRLSIHESIFFIL